MESPTTYWEEAVDLNEKKKEKKKLIGAQNRVETAAELGRKCLVN